ncbi:hypothetical protein NEOLEDRAFT_1181034 [Neolentinus lepideus HHB14362 ss-1]|uniref:Uncharacterized protein n=1 Tax=Neolentinus lepideus HHB14362 ss-1 TaxID=1314782 RepID=A0A165QDY1_9AGAM|nr:hypothetical protein NEOLEDRAFT_1181034 [Neolentinus lepideus HHB14362 ss-1]
MLSFMNRTTRRKAKKIDVTSIKHMQSLPSPESFTSPGIVDIKAAPLSVNRSNIGEEREQGDRRHQTRLASPKVQLELSSEPLSTFFPPELLRETPSHPTGLEVRIAPARTDSRRAFETAARNAKESEGNQHGRPAGSSANVDSPKEQAMNPGRRLPPAPIQIPLVNDAKTQIQRSASEGTAKSHPYASARWPFSDPDTRPGSMVDVDTELDNMSTISGTTLAQAFMANSGFTLTGSESRPRSGGISRQDSATLPRGEHPFINSPYWRDRRISANGEIVLSARSDSNSDIPPVPPVPTSALLLDIPPEMHSRPSSAVSYLGSDGESKASDTQIPSQTPPVNTRRGSARLHPNEPLNIRRISRISESSSPAPSTPEHSQQPSSAGSSRSAGQQDRTPPSSAPVSSSLSHLSESSSARSGEDIDHILDDYEFLSPMDNRLPGPHTASSSQLTVPSSTMPRSKSQRKDSTLSGRVIYSEKPELNIASAGSSSRASAVSQDKQPQRSTNLLPIGERSRSSSVSQSSVPLDDDTHGLSTSAPQRRLSRTIRRSEWPSSATSPAMSSPPVDDPPQSPDPLDNILLPVTRSIFIHQRSGSIPSPIRVVREPAFSLGIPVDEGDQTNESSTPSTGSGRHQQTFPETPRLFSPMWTPDTASAPPVPAVPPSPLPPQTRVVSANVVSSSAQTPRAEQSSSSWATTAPATVSDVGHRSRTATALTPTPTKESPPVTPHAQIVTITGSEMDVDPVAVQTPLPLSPLPLSRQPSPVPPGPVFSTPSPVVTQAEGPSKSASGTGTSEVNDVGSGLLEVPLPPTSSRVDITPSSPGSPVSSHRRAPPGPLPRRPRTPLEEPSLTILTPTFMPPPSYQAAVNDTPLRESSVPEYHLSQTSQNSPPAGSRRSARPRPPLPIGPRRPSQPGVHPFPTLAATGRERNGSVSSLASNAFPYRPSTPLSSPLRFQTVPVRFRGYTIDMAKWTFTSQQLQAIVSRAIVHSSHASSIRILSLDVLDSELPEEVRRLENLSGDLKTRYKLLARKRAALLGMFFVSQSDPNGAMDYSPRQRSFEDLTETCTSLDQVVEELHMVNDQIYQLKRLMDVHSSSALAMALRKLNASWAKKAAEVESLKTRVAALEAERDEAWKQAEDVAHDFDDLQNRLNENHDAGRQTPSSAMSASRRSSRVLVARKASLRASKAGLRPSSARRSVRLSTGSSQRASSVPVLSAARSTFSSDDVPPVPPIPPRRPGIDTSGLASRSSMGVSSGAVTALSAERAMVEAQLCDMLGITVGDLDNRASRRLSLTGLEGSARASSASPLQRRVSLPANPTDLGKFYDAMTSDSSW